MYCYSYDIEIFSLELNMGLRLIPAAYHYPGISKKPLHIRYNK